MEMRHREREREKETHTLTMSTGWMTHVASIPDNPPLRKGLEADQTLF